MNQRTDFWEALEEQWAQLGKEKRALGPDEALDVSFSQVQDTVAPKRRFESGNTRVSSGPKEKGGVLCKTE